MAAHHMNDFEVKCFCSWSGARTFLCDFYAIVVFGGLIKG